MNDTDDQSPYGRGFIAASIVIAAILLCGALLLVTDSSSGAAAGGEPPAVADAPAAEASGAPAVEAPATPASESGAGSTTQPAGSTGHSSGSGGCSLPADDQAVPTKPPSVDTWEVKHRVVVPRSSTYGPAKTDPAGFRRCFAHSPTGAVYAAYNAIAAIADQRQAIPTVRKLMVPGPDTEALIHELRSEDESFGSEAVQIAGYRLLDTERDRVTVMLALPVESAYMSATLTLVWYGDDWRLRPPSPGEPVGAPFAQHRDLSDFVAWSGI
jgi:hypothetical protein